MYLRDVKQKFKPNDNFLTNRGFLFCYLEDNKINIKVINILPEENDEQLNLHQLYQKYKTLVDDDNGKISIMQYFQIDDNGEDVEIHIPIVQLELKHIKEKTNELWSDKNVTNKQ